MRITGGEYRGRKLHMPGGGGVRPTQDRVREALFSMLMTELPGARFLDLFAGSGAVGLEALSRAAGEVVWVERDRKVWQTARRNVEEFGGERDAVICADTQAFLKRAAMVGRQFDIVFADPPYVRRVEDEGLMAVAEMLRGGILAEKGLFVLEQARKAHFSMPAGWKMFKERTYGSSTVRLLELTGTG